MNTRTPSLWARLTRASHHFLRRVGPTDAPDALEAYLSTAQNLHQLEDMQRQWDRGQRGLRHHGAH
ncbi:hypothetical protein [Hydrogenophaga palleronii]|uniref:hypothetical protein n=1 Tax=Hydrogenophaga palleronii TaxID=65655 RepID=UPI000824857C|nr:hypothetical protein [Hydrogenophaga palleronii]